MKLLTLNTHSWMEEKQVEKLDILCDAIITEGYDLISLQEVNQTIKEESIDASHLQDYQASTFDNQIKKDNFAWLLQQNLAAKGFHYNWTWEPSHIGYDMYDEGLAFLSRCPIQNTQTFYASQSTDYTDYKSRKVLGIQVKDTWYFNLHLGWWNDKREAFADQWTACETHFSVLSGPIFLLGDLNNPAQSSDEGYSLVTKNWLDTYLLASKRDNGYTIQKQIDGWSDNHEPLRIDFIFTNKPIQVHYSKVIFNGKNYPIISDHFGISIDWES